MALSVNPATRVITVPKADLTFLSGTLYQHDTNAFRLELKAYEESAQGIALPRTHLHNTTVTISGIDYIRSIQIINGYTVTYEDGQYAVNLIASNNNILDVANRNQVSIAPSNSAGAQVVTVGSGVTEQDKTDIVTGVWEYTGP